MPDSSWRLVGTCPRGKAVSFGEYMGVVSKVLADGSAAIECREVAAKYGSNAYMERDVLEDCGLSIGDRIAFCVQPSSSGGSPEVKSPVWTQSPAKREEREEPEEREERTERTERTEREEPSPLRRPPTPPPRLRSRTPIAKRRSAPSALALPMPRTWSEEWLVGSVVDADERRGSCTVACQIDGREREVYVPGDVVEAGCVKVKDTVALRLIGSSRSTSRTPRAGGHLWRLMGWPNRTVPHHFTEHHGQVSRILPNGNGFLDCPELSRAYGRDVFLHNSVIQECSLALGDNIAFSLHVSPSGNPQVSAPCWKRCPGGSDEVQDEPEPAYKQRPAYGRERTRRLRSRSPQMAWRPRLGEKSPPRNALPALRGRSAARNKWVPRDSLEASTRVVSREERRPSVSAAGSFQKGQKEWEWEGHQLGWMPKGFYLGWVTRTDQRKGTSMVQCPDWGGRQDVYVHRSVAEPSALEEGDTVAFQIHVNKRGQPQASAPFWKKVGWTPKGKPLCFGEHQGLIARILPNGCAFLDCKEIRDVYQRDAYIHQAVMKQCDLVEGNFIAFNVHISSSGNPQVSAPAWICCSDDKWMKDIVPGTLSQGQGEPRAKSWGQDHDTRWQKSDRGRGDHNPEPDRGKWDERHGKDGHDDDDAEKQPEGEMPGEAAPADVHMRSQSSASEADRGTD